MLQFPIQLVDGSTIQFIVDKIYTNKRYSNYYSIPMCGIVYALFISHSVRNYTVRKITITLVKFTTVRMHNREYINYRSKEVVATSTERY
jgi:hypothetical protein